MPRRRESTMSDLERDLAQAGLDPAETSGAAAGVSPAGVALPGLRHDPSAVAPSAEDDDEGDDDTEE
jgi:hypothetical protein